MREGLGGGGAEEEDRDTIHVRISRSRITVVSGRERGWETMVQRLLPIALTLSPLCRCGDEKRQR